MRVLVTGGSGFIGTNLIAFFLSRGAAVKNLDSKAPRQVEHHPYWNEGDVRDFAAVRTALTSFAPTHVIHMAARTDLHGRTLEDYSANTVGVKSVIEAIKACTSVERVIFASSMLVCRAGYQPRSDDDYAPSTVYGHSKVIGETIVRSAALAQPPWTLVRPSSIWGPWFGEPYRDFFLAVLNRRFVKFGAGQTLKTFGYVGNLVHQILALLSAPGDAVHARTLNLGDEPPLNVEDWADMIAREAGLKPPRRVPFSLMRAAALVGDVLQMAGLKSPMTTFRLTNMTTNNAMDLKHVYAIAGPPPYSLEAGIRETLNWLATQR